MSEQTTTFTPGPWARSKHVLNFGRVITREAHLTRPFGAAVDSERCRATYMQSIAEVSRHPCHLEHGLAEAEANEHLIAAAPDLYAALKAVVTDAVGGGAFHNLTGENATAALAALAKAEGR